MMTGMERFLFPCLFFSGFWAWTGSEVFSSVLELQGLMKANNELTGRLEKYINAEKLKIKKLEKVLEERKGRGVRRLPSDMENPLDAFQVVRQSFYGFKPIQDLIKVKYDRLLLGDFPTFPVQRDVDGAVAGIVRLQQTYKLDVAQFSRGIVAGQQTEANLDAEDCFEIGLTAFKMNQTQSAAPWLLEGVKRIRTEVKEAMGSRTKDKMNRALDLLEQMTSITESSYLNDSTISIPDPWAVLPNRDSLYSYYVDDTEYYSLARVPVSVLSVEPEILLAKNFVSKGEIAELKNLSLSRFREAFTLGNTRDIRISDMAVLNNTIPMVARFEDKLYHFAGIGKKIYERLQIGLYGLAGFYGTHMDSAYQLNRTASLIAYLSTPKFGGRTVFPDLGIAVEATEGDVVMWRNHHANMTLDYRSRHGGCPVLLGSKWFANKWLRYPGWYGGFD